MDYTEGGFSPALFREWSAIAMVGGALERRVWMKLGSRTSFGNLYTLLVATPGVGKFVIETVRDLWTHALEPGTKVPAFRVSPDSMSKASLMDTLAKAKGSSPLTASVPMQTYHSLLIAAEEYGVLMPSYDLEYIGVLNSIYNNKALHEEARRTGSVRELKIEFPQLNILAGTQPGWLASVFPEEAWSTGLTARLIMVYASETPLKSLFEDSGGTAEQRDGLLRKLGHFSALWGQAAWGPGASAAVDDWHMAGGPPAPEHSRLAHYNKRRTSLHMPKLALISAVSRTGQLTIELQDVRRAVSWLTHVETFMPDIFRAMLGKSDSQVLEELHRAMIQKWTVHGKKALPESFVWNFLKERVPSPNILRLIETAERSGLMERVANTTSYHPKPRYEFEQQ